MIFNEVWDNYRNHLLNFIRTKIDDEYLAEDILQEVGIKLIENLNRETKIKNYKSWLFQVTRNTIADYYRKRNKQPELTFNQLETSSLTCTCFCDLLGFMIQTYLPEKYSKPLYLSDIEQISQQEISEILNLSLTATKSRIQRGRKKLKSLIEGCVNIVYNSRNQVVDVQLKDNCELPQELKLEIERLNLML